MDFITLHGGFAHIWSFVKVVFDVTWRYGVSHSFLPPSAAHMLLVWYRRNSRASQGVYNGTLLSRDGVGGCLPAQLLGVICLLAVGWRLVVQIMWSLSRCVSVIEMICKDKC